MKTENTNIGDLKITLRRNTGSEIMEQLRSNTLRGMRGELVSHLYKEVKGMGRTRWEQSCGIRFSPIVAIDEQGNYHEFSVGIDRWVDRHKVTFGGGSEPLFGLLKVTQLDSPTDDGWKSSCYDQPKFCNTQASDLARFAIVQAVLQDLYLLSDKQTHHTKPSWVQIGEGSVRFPLHAATLDSDDYIPPYAHTADGGKFELGANPAYSAAPLVRSLRFKPGIELEFSATWEDGKLQLSYKLSGVVDSEVTTFTHPRKVSTLAYPDAMALAYSGKEVRCKNWEAGRFIYLFTKVYTDAPSKDLHLTLMYDHNGSYTPTSVDKNSEWELYTRK